MRKPKLVLWIGLFLLLSSAYTVFLLEREVWLENILDSRYHAEDVFEQPVGSEIVWIPLSYEWRGQHVALLDDYETGNHEPDARKAGIVRIIINGKDYSIPQLVEVRPNDHDDNRYFMQVTIIKFTDRQLHRECLVILQSYPDYNLYSYYMLHSDALTCRALFLDYDGKVTEERFRFSDRNQPLYRTLLADEVSPSELGIYSNIRNAWPSIFFPFLYPGVSLMLGFVMTLFGSMLAARAKNRKPQDS